MDFISAKQLAEKWGIDQTRVHRLAREGRIRGAARFGRNWMFPADAKKPADGRTGQAKNNPQADDYFRFPLYVNFEEKDYTPPLSDEELTLRRGQLLFQSCQFAQADQVLVSLEHGENRYVRLSALCHRLCIAIYENNSDFDMLLWRMKMELSQNFAYKKETELLLFGFDADHVAYRSLLEKFAVDSGYLYHPSCYSVLALVAFIPIQNGEFSLMSKLRYDTQELICQQMERGGYYLEAQKMHYLLSVAYQLQNNTDKMETHIRCGLSLAMEHGLYYVAAFYERWYRAPTQRVLRDFPADFSQKIQSLGTAIQQKQARFEESHNDPSYITMLSDNEFEYAFLANQNYTNREIAQMMKASEKKVSRIYSEIYDKLGVKNK